MKKIINLLLNVCIVTSAIFSKAQAQKFEPNLAFTTTKVMAALKSFEKEEPATDKTAAVVSKESLKQAKTNLKVSKESFNEMKANFKSSEHFKKQFKNATDVTWSSNAEAIIASLNRGNVRTNVVYNKKGSWIHTLTYYLPGNIPANVTTQMNAVYPNDDITLAVEVVEGGIDFFIVQIENKRSFRQVGLYNGETNEIAVYTKTR